MKEVTRYQCDHCKKTFAKNLYAHRHELICWANPAVKACRSCKYQHQHFVPVEGSVNTVWQDGHYCEIGIGDGNNIRHCHHWVRR